MTEINNEDDYDHYDDYDDDDDDEDIDVIYEPEEVSSTRYNIIICELYNEFIHGKTNNNIVKSHYIVNIRFKKLNEKVLDEIEYVGRRLYSEFINKFTRRNLKITHPIFRNYQNIISRNDYIKPEIAQCIYLETNECIAILKTFWIKLIQRKWRNIVKIRNDIMQKRSKIKSLRHRELTGRWPDDCANYPVLKGMLYEIKN
jgi:hypothetical protein